VVVPTVLVLSRVVATCICVSTGMGKGTGVDKAALGQHKHYERPFVFFTNCIGLACGSVKWLPHRNSVHQENWKALVGLATRSNKSQTRANKTKPD
jgi:hypothetical protein